MINLRECFTTLLHGSPFSLAYHKIFSQLFFDGTKNLLSLYTKKQFFFLKHTLIPLHHSIPAISEIVHFLVFSKQLLPNVMDLFTVVLKLLIVHFLNTVTLHFLQNGYLSSHMIVLNVNETNTSIENYQCSYSSFFKTCFLH